MTSGIGEVAVAVDVRVDDIVAAAAVGLAKALKLPELLQVAPIIGGEDFVLVEAGLRDDRGMHAI